MYVCLTVVSLLPFAVSLQKGLRPVCRDLLHAFGKGKEIRQHISRPMRQYYFHTGELGGFRDDGDGCGRGWLREAVHDSPYCAGDS